MNLIEEFETTCGWCGHRVPPQQQIFAAGARIHSDIDLSGKAGQVVEVHVDSPDKRILAAVPGKESEALRDGHDLVFMVCSEACGQALKQAMDEQLHQGKTLGLA